MTIETVESVGLWALETFGAGDPNSPARCLRLLEEVVELCYADGAAGCEISDRVNGTILKCFVKYAASGPLRDDVPGELADCSIVLKTIAHQKGIDLDAEEAAKMKTNRERTWKSNGDGTGQHQ